MQFIFRPITREDFPQLSLWLSTPHVRQWWDDDKPDLDWLEDNYGPVINGEDPTMMFVAEFDGRDIGFIQCYRNADNPGHLESIKVPNSVGIDLYIGELDLVGQGIGKSMIQQFVEEVIKPSYPEETAVVADPCIDNPASVRAFEKAGFTKGIIKPDDEGRMEQVMVLDI
jgi:aminoglycoside 6'-N-acetyltransferase